MPVRIYDIAKKFGIESKAVLAKARELGIAAMVPSSSLDKLTAEFLESHFRPPESSPSELQVLPLPVVVPKTDSALPVTAPSPELASSYRDDSYGIRLVRDSEVEMHAFADDGFRHVGSFAFIVSPESVGANGNNSATDPDKVVLLTNSESGSLEFKPAARWDCYQNRHNPELQKAIVKTVASFLNTDGGALLIGVADNGRVLGLKEDFATLQKGKDAYLLFLGSLFCDNFGSGLSSCWQTGIERLGDKVVCVVHVRRAPRPVIVKDGQAELFFARVGNSSRSLSMSAMAEHCRLRWGVAPTE